MKTIEILRPGNGSQFYQGAFLVDGAPDPEIVKLFGTHIVPTPFGPSADAETVRADIAARNKSVTVTVRDQILAGLGEPQS